MSSRDSRRGRHAPDIESKTLHELKILVPHDLYRAWQRCSWVLVSETGKSRTEIMEEMIRDFLVKHGC